MLQRAVRAAWRRKALEPVGLPIGVVALDAGQDGKAILLLAVTKYLTRKLEVAIS